MTALVECGSNASICGDNLRREVAAAAPGTVLELQEGVYGGSTGDHMLSISNNVTLRAQSPGRVVLDGEDWRQVVWIGGGTVYLEGLNITQGRAGDGGGGLRIDGGNVTMSGCTIHGNTADDVSSPSSRAAPSSAPIPCLALPSAS